MPFHGLKNYAIGAAALAAAGFAVAPPAQATLFGDTVTVTSEANAPLDTWTDNVVVGAGVELQGGDSSNHANTNQGQNFPALFPGDSIDIGANSITFTFAALGGGLFPYPFITTFSDLDWTDAPSTLQSVAVAAGASGLTSPIIDNVTEHSFRFQGTVELSTGANFTLDLTREIIQQPRVPEPATLPVLAAGLIGLMIAGVRRRRRA